MRWSGVRWGRVRTSRRMTAHIPCRHSKSKRAHVVGGVHFGMHDGRKRLCGRSGPLRLHCCSWRWQGCLSRVCREASLYSTFGSTYGGTASGRTQEQDYYYLLLLPASPVLRHIQHFVPPLNQPSSHINLTRTRIRHGEQLRILLLSSHRGASTIKIRQPTSTSYTIHCLFAMPNNTGTRRFAKGFWNIWKPD